MLQEFGMIKGGIIQVDKSTSAHKFYIKKWHEEKRIITKAKALNLINAFESQCK
jgi:hypothetical protein